MIASNMPRAVVTFHERIRCNECLYHSSNMQEYEQHLAVAHEYSKRKIKAAVTRYLRQHSMCRDCWKTHYGRLSSVGHETPQKFRIWETCCFCGKRHKDGINEDTSPDRHDLLCKRLR